MLPILLNLQLVNQTYESKGLRLQRVGQREHVIGNANPISVNESVLGYDEDRRASQFDELMSINYGQVFVSNLNTRQLVVTHMHCGGDSSIQMSNFL